MKSAHNIQNILIIKPGAIGDVLQLTPVIRALKRAYPESTITLIVGSSTTADLFRHNPRVAETIVFDKRGEHRSLRSLLRLWKELRRKDFDLVLNFQRSNPKTWFLASSAFPCTVRVYHKARHRTVHAVVNYLETIAPLGIRTEDLELDFSPGPEARAFAEKLLADVKAGIKPLVALNPGASHPLKQWSTDRFAGLADILSRDLSANAVILGGSDDISLAEDIARKTTSKPLLLAGKLDILQLGAVLEFCDVLVSGDTGPMHVATAVGTPVAGLFGPTDPARTGPVGRGHRVIQAAGVSCVPCKSLACTSTTYLECMNKISPRQVYEAIKEMVRERKGTRRKAILCDLGHG